MESENQDGSERKVEENQEVAQSTPQEDNPENARVDEEDILKTGWFYIDSSGNRQVLSLAFDFY